MLTKSEIALLTVTVLGTLTAWLAAPHPSLMSPVFGEPRIACGAPAAGKVHAGWLPPASLIGRTHVAGP